ncbi:hypothetical protein KUCAC02_002239, partial [Chaenocephalus aceratus]
SAVNAPTVSAGCGESGLRLLGVAGAGARGGFESFVVEARRSHVDLVTPPAFPTKSDQRLKTLLYILMPIRSSRLTARGRNRGGGQHYLIAAPLSPWSLCNTLEERERNGHSMQDQQITHQTGNGSFIENEVNRRFEPGLWLAMLASSRVREEPGEGTVATCAESEEDEAAGVSTSRLDAHTYCSVA